MSSPTRSAALAGSALAARRIASRVASLDIRVAVPPVVFALLLIDIAFPCLYLLDYAAGHPSWFLARLLDLDGEANLPAWYSSSQLLLVSVTLGLFAARRSREHGTWLWPVLVASALFLAMSLDEVAQIHEWLGTKTDLIFEAGPRRSFLLAKTGFWMFLFGLPALALVVWLWRATLSMMAITSTRVKVLLIVGFTTFMGSALGTELISNFVVAGSWSSAVQVAVEESGEMAGVTLLLWGALELLSPGILGLERRLQS